MGRSGIPDPYYKMKSHGKDRSSETETASFERTRTKTTGEQAGQRQGSSSAAKKPSEWLLKVGHQSMVRLIDAVFDLLQMCAYEINQATKGSELELSWLRPAPEKDRATTEFDADTPKQLVMSGRISTRYWSLIVRGTALEIDVYILPADKLLGFNANPTMCEPYGRLNARPLGTGVGWYIEDTLLEREHVTLIAKHLMEALMKCARKEKLKPNAFTTTLLRINAADLEERQIQRENREQFFADLKARLEATPSFSREMEKAQEEKLQANSEQDSWAIKMSPKETVEPVLPSNGWSSSEKNSGAGGAQHAALLTEELSPQERRTVEEDAMTELVPSDVITTVSTTKEPQIVPQPQSLNGEYVMKASAPQPVAPQQPASQLVASETSVAIDLPNALQILLNSLDLELEAVAQAGAQAFNNRNFTRAQAILEFSSRLSEFRQTSKQLLDDYLGES
jgi:hypothetical protein